MSDETTPEVVELPVDAAANEALDRSHTVTVLGKDFGLVKELGLAASYLLEKSQKEESLSGFIDSMARLIVKADRAEFMEHILSDSDEDGELTADQFGDIFKESLEKVIGRPLDTTTS